jgi:hypothetical protein
MQKGAFQSRYSIFIFFSSLEKYTVGVLHLMDKKELDKIRFITVQRVCCCILVDWVHLRNLLECQVIHLVCP